MNTSSDGYKMLAAINSARKHTQSWSHPMTERYVLDNLYCYSRGDMFVALTNKNDQVNIQSQVPWNEGTQVCNIFNTSDCQNVQGGKINISLNNGEQKIFIPSSSSHFDVEFFTA